MKKQGRYDPDTVNDYICNTCGKRGLIYHQRKLAWRMGVNKPWELCNKDKTKHFCEVLKDD